MIKMTREINKDTEIFSAKAIEEFSKDTEIFSAKAIEEFSKPFTYGHIFN